MTALPVITPASSKFAGRETLQGRSVDLADNERIGVLMELVGDLSRLTEPKDVLRVFSEGMRELYGVRGYISLSTRNLNPGEYRITRMLTESGGALRIHTADPWSVINTLPIHTGGFFGEIIRSAYPQLIHHLNVHNDPVVGNALAAFGSLMAIPLFDGGEPLNWAITLDKDPEGFSVEELEETILRANLVGGTVKNTVITKQLREANDRIQREIDQIARIQRALLPDKLPEIPGMRIATSYETFDRAGGDLYDFAVLPSPPDGPTRFDGWLAMLIADASGHGPAASVLTAMLNTLVYAYPRHGSGPGAALEFANQHLHAKRIEGAFLTAFLAVYNPADRTLMYARAGHNPPLLKNPGAGGSVTRLEAVGGIPLGVADSAAYENATIKL
ncbi:MAG: SpoIIE family protein phosphatase, partial [Phycisphaerales bacterium]|nr:SpoIIE family protein phosphatase [Phycisphaerales bacterium]